jgi:hypothetical protein
VIVVLDPNNVVESPDDEVPGSFIAIRPLVERVSVPSPLDATHEVQILRTVELDFPFRSAAFDDEKAVSLVDGQQRTAALALVDVDDRPNVHLATIGLLANQNEATHIFQVANNTQKITTQFTRALLAQMDTVPRYLREEKNLASACNLLALRKADPPFYQIVKYPGADNGNHPVVYNSRFKVVSIFADQLPHMNDSDKLAEVVLKSFNIVKLTWPKAWGQRPTYFTRLMHGAGLLATAAMVVRVLTGSLRAHHNLAAPEVWTELTGALKRLKTRVVWTHEEALAGNRVQKANWQREISTKQNTRQDIEALTNFLVRESLAVSE